MILNDKEIIENLSDSITPFVPEQVKIIDGQKIPSFGCGSFGYDIRLSNEFKVFENSDEPLDIKNWASMKTILVTKDYFIIPPNDMVLCNSLELFDMPKNIQTIAVGKSTYARVGIIANVTPIEAGWKGQLVIELSNTTKRPVKIYANEGIIQLIFFKGNDCNVSYADREGKYQNQTGITLAKV